MASDVNFSRVTVRISNHFEGPNFVNGLAKQTASYTVISDTLARLEFTGGFNEAITYVQHLHGTGFGIDADGRYTGFVDGYTAFEKGARENGWSFSGLDVALDHLNNLVADFGVSFKDLLLIPLEYTFIGAEYNDIYITGSFDDIAYGYAGDDNFEGLTGHDRLFGGSGNDTMTGGEGNDLLRGGSGDDRLFGGDDDDMIFGGDGDDFAAGGAGNDTIRLGGGDDTANGGSGADIIAGDAGADRISGGDGGDTLSGGDGNDRLFGGDGGDTLNGGRGNDVLVGGAGTNFLFGQDGKDTLRGSTGSDELFGGRGNDRLNAGLGADFVNGGGGDDRLSANGPGGAGDKAVDTFIFEAAFGDDVITDFEVGLDSLIFAAGITAGNLTSEAIGEDVLLEVSVLGGQSVLLEGAAGSFDPAIDIQFV